MAGDRALRVGVVGLGSWGIEHVRAWHSTPGARLVAVCDNNLARSREVSSQYAVESSFASAADMANQAALDIVSIVNDERDRLAATLPFLRAGVHALVEKPIATDFDSAQALAEAAIESGVMVMPGHVLRFDVRFATVAQRIRQNELGTIRSVFARRLIPKSRYWQYQRTHPALMASLHDFDLARWLLDAEPMSVTSYGSTERTDMPWPDLLWFVLQFPRGATAVVETAFALPDKAGLWLESETEIIGTNGVARVKLPGDTIGFWLDGGAESPETALTAHALGSSFGALRDEIAYFLSCVTAGTPPARVTIDDGVRSTRIALAAMESIRSKASVSISHR
jgi:UDP-N-acetylglucosamine 3-dehydrogenase